MVFALDLVLYDGPHCAFFGWSDSSGSSVVISGAHKWLLLGDFSLIWYFEDRNDSAMATSPSGQIASSRGFAALAFIVFVHLLLARVLVFEDFNACFLGDVPLLVFFFE